MARLLKDAMTATAKEVTAAERVRNFINSKISPTEGVYVCNMPDLSVISAKLRAKRAKLRALWWAPP
ncbi:hypothetical protein GCM10023063_33280 [Arthrobacter methylotrophus]